MVIIGVRRFGTYYINIGADPNITCIANLHLSLDQMINYSMHAPFKEVHIVCIDLYMSVYIIILKYAQTVRLVLSRLSLTIKLNLFMVETEKKYNNIIIKNKLFSTST